MKDIEATVTYPVHFRTVAAGRRQLRRGRPPKPPKVEPGHIPRVARLLALAHHFDRLIRQGAVRDLADLARLGGVTRARSSQIMGLLLLASDIQEQILTLPRTRAGRPPVTERSLRMIAAEPLWARQREMWAELTRVSAVSKDTHGGSATERKRETR